MKGHGYGPMPSRRPTSGPKPGAAFQPATKDTGKQDHKSKSASMNGDYGGNVVGPLSKSFGGKGKAGF